VLAYLLLFPQSSAGCELRLKHVNHRNCHGYCLAVSCAETVYITNMIRPSINITWPFNNGDRRIVSFQIALFTSSSSPLHAAEP
jgi:hypothetical protein